MSSLAMLQSVRAALLARLGFAGRWALLLLAVLRSLRQPREWWRPTMQEIRRQTVDALWLVLVLCALGGALIAQQTGYQFQGTLPSWVVGSIVAASLITEVTPLFAAIAMVGLIGTRIAAELGVMKVTDQVDALDAMGRDPVAYLVTPRVLAAAFVGPLLTALALVASMTAGWLTALVTTRATTPDFWFGVRHYMRDFPMFFAVIKGFAFTTMMGLTASHIGLEAQGGSIGVGRSTRSAVVVMMALVIVLDTALVPLLKVVRQ